MPASFSPAPNSMASLSIEEGASARQNSSNLDTATTTVPVVMPVEKKPECEMVGGSSSVGAQAQADGEKEGEKDGKKKKNRCLSCKKKPECEMVGGSSSVGAQAQA